MRHTHRILISGVHPALFRSQVNALLQLGHEIVVPREQNFFGYGDCAVHLDYLTSEVRAKLQPATEKELPQLGLTLVWGGSWEQLHAARRLSVKLDCPLLLYGCCNDVPYTSEHGRYLLSEDLITFVKSSVPHKRFLVFPPDYSLFAPGEIKRDAAIATLINNYESEWPLDYSQYEILSREFGHEWEFHRARGLSSTQVARLLQKSAALLHIKSKEASGNAMMEALACGCPVIVNESLLSGRTCSLFLEPGYNSWLLRTGSLSESFVEALQQLPQLQTNAAASIRHSVRHERALHVLDEITQFIARES